MLHETLAKIAARQELYSLRFSESGNMERCIGKFELAADKFRKNGGIMEVSEEMEIFHTSLPSSYNSVRDWLSNQPIKDRMYETLKRKAVEVFEYSHHGENTPGTIRSSGQANISRLSYCDNNQGQESNSWWIDTVDKIHRQKFFKNLFLQLQ